MPGWENLAQYMEQKGVSPETLVEAGLAIRGKQGRIYDAYRDRIIFPKMCIRDRFHPILPDLVGGGQAKYLETAAVRKDRPCLLYTSLFDWRYPGA